MNTEGRKAKGKGQRSEQGCNGKGVGDGSRRAFIRAASATGAGVLMSGLPSGWVGGAYAGDGPETSTIRFGIIALTDCAPIVMAHELGYFKKFGVDSIVSKEASWAVIRDKLSLGENQATHIRRGCAHRGEPRATAQLPRGAPRNASAAIAAPEEEVQLEAHELC